MRTLAIETASEACSVALFDGVTAIAHDHRVLGRGHAEALVPMIAALPAKGRADRILVSLGPGSFTGVRIGLATARALGVAWGAQVLGYPTLALVAAMARSPARQPDASGREPLHPVTVCMNAGHGQWFIQNFDADGLPQAPVASLTPQQAGAHHCHALIAGNRARDLAATRRDTPLQAFDTLPDASHALLLPAQGLTADLTPIYGRAPDATPQKQTERR